MWSKLRLITIALGTVVLLVGVGIWLGGHPEHLPIGVRNALVDDDRALRAEVEAAVADSYYRQVDSEDLENGSLEGMVRALPDDFSHYFSPRDARSLAEGLSGNFEGIGITIQEHKAGLEVVRVFDDSPAADVGLRTGDVITRVEGSSIAGESAELASSKIKGPAGTKVELTYVRPDSGRERTVDAERARIDVPVVDSKVETVDGHRIGVLTLLSFTDGVHALLAEEVERLVDDGVEGIVLDLRGNGGGLLTESVLAASVFIEDGRIVSTRGRASPERDYDTIGTASDTETPIVVLVDGGTASAAEILTGALRDRGRAVAVVGEKTFGKGVFQEVKPLSNGGAVNLTVGSYYLPDGENLAEDGIKPEVRARDKPTTRRDEALPTALAELARHLSRR